MPVPLWTGKAAETRFNVTTDFASLGLHSAAATGNVGLVEYALARGQPVNSVLDGVLPLHAAAAGGNERVLKLLIERGADVNAPRLPRRYSNDKNRDTSAPIVGTTGSTPLHFAAANGNTSIVTALLLRGAHADRPDKHGVTPEMLARQNGWDECAEVLKTWVLNKDRDLRERQPPQDVQEATGLPLGRFTSRDRAGSAGEGEGSTRRRIHMKRSMDTALSMLKGSSEALKPPPTSNLASMTPPASPIRPFGEYTFYSNDSSPSPIDPGSRRPSLPHITYPAPPSVHRKTSLATRANPRRPRSAGTDAEGEDAQSSARSGTSRKLASKYSLLNMFKKGAEGVPLERTATQGSSGFSSSSSVALSGDSSPGPRRPTNMSPSTQIQQLPLTHKSPPRPPIPLAVDLHNALAQHQHRERSGSGASTSFDPALFMGDSNQGSPSSFPRLGVFRPGHVRDRSGTPPPVLLADTRPRGLSVTSSTSSLSPALSNGDGNPTIIAEFPFSLSDPPPILPEPQMGAGGNAHENRIVTVATPPQRSPLPLEQSEGEAATNMNERRSHTPLDINLSLISSHAQAEALVQKELQDILEMPVVSADSKGSGWMPLSARLAAYGESLQIERKFRPELSPVDDTPTEARPQQSSTRRPLDNGIERQNSLDHKTASTRRRTMEPKRPHTSSGTDSPSTECTRVFFSVTTDSNSFSSPADASFLSLHFCSLVAD
ncbi:hypothetical protein FB45DRAFT_734224 [Roridomyces roridus]|uniref:Ankyrin n=1 Tax=Roridomyces roridus TaxID=1738132 RepID=A0AAD7FZE4_9AGAR|nr:hypothetical protein FB45DRAFT_734224 [Roridomyces roridus]